MSENSKIEWTDNTWTPIRARAAPIDIAKDSIGWYCEHVSDGCANCYAESMNNRLGTGLPFKPGHRKNVEIFLDEKMLFAPLRWKRPRMVFVCSMTDLFGGWVKDEWIDKIFAIMALCPQHTFQVLTKRAERMQEYCKSVADESDQASLRRFAPHMNFPWPKDWPGFEWPLNNVWLGISAERQQEADKRIPHLLETPAAVRFVSLEPLLGPISFRWAKWQPFNDPGTTDHLDGARRLDWVIVGGESGPKARPMNPQWPRELRDQCQEAAVPYFFKQWGENLPQELIDDGIDPNTPWRADPNGGLTWALDELRVSKNDWPKVTFIRVGKRAAGRLLDGREWNEMPRR